MRKLIVTTLATAMIVLFATMNMTAQQQYEIKVRPIALAKGDFKVGGEFLKSNKIGFELNAGYNTGQRLVNFDTYEEKGFEVGAAAKYYLRPKTVADGYYVSMYGNYISTSYIQTEQNAFNNNQVNVGFMLGYKKVYKSGFFIEGAMGVGQALVNENSATANSTIDITSVPTTSLRLPGRIAVGIRF